MAGGTRDQQLPEVGLGGPEPARGIVDVAKRSLLAFLRPLMPHSEMEKGLHRRGAEAKALLTELEEANRTSVMAESLSGVGYWRYVPDTQSRTWSPSTFAIFGLDPAAGVPPEGGVDMFDPEDQDILMKSIQGIATGRPPDYEYAITRVDGGRRYVRMTGSLERHADGRVSHMYGVIIDVTDAKLRQQAIAESEARYRLLADSVSDVIVRYDARGVIEFISPSVRALGYQPDDIVGRRITEFEAAGLALETLDELARYEAGLPFPTGRLSETRLQHGSGTAVWMESVETGIYDDAGVFVGVVAVLRDVTERRAMNEALQRKQIEAEAASVAKSEFLSNMSHELRTPLTGIIGFSGLLEGMDGLPEKARTYVSRVLSGGEALLSVVNDILDFTKLEAGHVELDPHAFHPRALVDESRRLLQMEARKKGLELRAEFDPMLPAMVVADGARIRQVLLNLLGNAIKFTAKGEVTVSAGYDPGDGHLLIRVTDTGIGIPTELTHRLFQRFSQIDGSISREYGGTGLGLAISKRLVEMMGGEIGVESEVGVGSTFWFTIAALCHGAHPLPT